MRSYLAVQREVDGRMSTLLRDAARDTAKRITELMASPSYSSAVRRAQLQLVLRETYAELDSMFGGMNREISRGLKAATKAAAEAETLLMRPYFDAAGAKPLGDGYLREQLKLGAQTARNLESRLSNGISLSRQVYRTETLTKGWMEKVINRALVRGASAKELSKEVRGFIRPDVRGGVSYAANRLARTEINNAFHTTQLRIHEDEPWVDGIRWNLSGSHPRHDKCNDYAEQVHYTGGEAGVFRNGAAPSKPHPQCLCYVTAELVDEGTFVSKLTGGKYDRYASRFA